MASTHVERSKAIEEANTKSVVDVAHSLGMDLVRTGRNYYWSEHDSFKITPSRNTFYWNSRRFGGGPIQLVETIRECSFREAVNFINGAELGKFSEQDFPKKKPFNYFMKENPEMTEARKYLSEERKLSAETIEFFIKQGLLAQAVYTNPDNGPKETVVVFKHKDLNGKIRGVGLQGIYEDWAIHPDRGRLKKTFGDGFTGFSVPIGKPPSAGELTKDRPLKIIAFEAPIDLMSYYELHKDSLEDVVLLSMNGLRKETISKYIANVVGSQVEEEEKVTVLDELDKRVKSSGLIEIVLAVDNDEAKPIKGTDPVEYAVAGQDFVDNFGIENIPVSTHIPELQSGQTKSDWNEFMKLTKEASMVEEFLSENKKLGEGANMSFKGNDDLLKNYYAESAETIAQGFDHFMTETADQNYRNEMWGSLRENFISYENEMVERGLLNPENVAAENEATKNTIESSQPRENLSGNQNLEDSILSKNEIGNNRYLEVEFNESNPELGIRRYQGELVTPELIVEIESMESRVAKDSRYLKFYFDEVVDGKVVERHRIDVGDGLEANKPMYDFLKEAAVSKDRAATIKPGLVVAGGSNQKVESAETVEVQPVDRYFRVESNEQIMPLVFDNYAGQVVTRDFISELYSLENRGGYPVESCKFVFAEVIDGEVIDHIEMEVGGNYAENREKHDRLTEGAVSREKAEEIKQDQLIPEAPTVEDTIVDQQPSVQLETKPGEPEIGKNESSKIMQASSPDFLSEFKQALDDTFDQMEKKPEGTNEYLTKSDLDKILDEHLTKIEQLVSHFTTSDSLLENPTEEQRVGLVRGMLETVKAAITQFKDDLLNKLSTKKDNAIFNVKDTTDTLRISTKNSVNGRILKINDSIKQLTGKIDNKFVLEEKVVRSKPDSKEPGEQVVEELDPVVELAGEPVKEQSEAKENDLVHLTREYLQLTEETHNISESIQQEIVKDPLADVKILQGKLFLNNQLIKELEQQIAEKMPAQSIEESKEQAVAAVVSLSELVKQSDQFAQQRDELAHQPDFLRSMSTDGGKGSLVAQFKELDSRVSALDKEIQSIENGTREVATPEKQIPDNDSITMAAAADGNFPKEVSVSQAVSPEKSTKPLQEISESTNVNELTANLKAGVKDLLEPDSFKNYLDSASKFHNYSSNNVQLIMNQDSEATQVASPNKWNQLGYEVNANAKELLVYAPNFQVKQDNQGQPVLDGNGKEVQELAGFRLTPVYDVRHTTASRDIRVTEFDLTNEEQFAKVYQGIAEASKADVSISTEAESTFSKDDNTISVGRGLGYENTVKTLVEAAAKLNYSKTSHQGKSDPVIEDFEAKAVRYIVSNHLGLDTSDLSFEFVSSMKENYSDNKLNRSLETITKQASAMIKEIDKKFDQAKSLNGPKNKFEERVAKGKTDNQRTAAEAKNKNYTPETKEQSTAIRR